MHRVRISSAQQTELVLSAFSVVGLALPSHTSSSTWRRWADAMLFLGHQICSIPCCLYGEQGKANKTCIDPDPHSQSSSRTQGLIEDRVHSNPPTVLSSSSVEIDKKKDSMTKQTKKMGEKWRKDG